MSYIIFPERGQISRRCSGNHPRPFVFTPGSGSGAYCSFHSHSSHLCTWWNGGTRPSRSLGSRDGGRGHLRVALISVNLLSPPVPGCRMTCRRRHGCVWYQLIVFVPVYGHKPTGFQKDTKCQSDRSLATLAAEGERLVKTRERWKLHFLTIRTSPS